MVAGLIKKTIFNPGARAQLGLGGSVAGGSVANNAMLNMLAASTQMSTTSLLSSVNSAGDSGFSNSRFMVSTEANKWVVLAQNASGYPTLRVITSDALGNAAAGTAAVLKSGSYTIRGLFIHPSNPNQVVAVYGSYLIVATISGNTISAVGSEFTTSIMDENYWLPSMDSSGRIWLAQMDSTTNLPTIERITLSGATISSDISGTAVSSGNLYAPTDSRCKCIVFDPDRMAIIEPSMDDVSSTTYTTRVQIFNITSGVPAYNTTAWAKSTQVTKNSTRPEPSQIKGVWWARFANGDAFFSVYTNYAASTESAYVFEPISFFYDRSAETVTQIGTTTRIGTYLRKGLIQNAGPNGGNASSQLGLFTTNQHPLVSGATDTNISNNLMYVQQMATLDGFMIAATHNAANSVTGRQAFTLTEYDGGGATGTERPEFNLCAACIDRGGTKLLAFDQVGNGYISIAGS